MGQWDGQHSPSHSKLVAFVSMHLGGLSFASDSFLLTSEQDRRTLTLHYITQIKCHGVYLCCLNWVWDSVKKVGVQCYLLHLKYIDAFSSSNIFTFLSDDPGKFVYISSVNFLVAMFTNQQTDKPI